MRRPPLLLTARTIAAVAVGCRLVRSGLAQRSAEPLGRELDPDVTISIIVPARNEDRRLGPLLDALRGAPGVVQVVVVDDESTDATARVGCRDGVSVVAGSPRPPGWAGKTWAMQQGLEAATGEWVVFIDADLRPQPDLPGRLVARARRDRVDLISLAPAATAPPLARLVHASFLATLVYRFGGPGCSRRGRELANGQCLAVEREPFVGRGGWRPVAAAVTEDVALARHLAERGGRTALIDAAADARVDVRDVHEVVTGWGRSIGLPGLGRIETTLDAVLLTLTMPLPIVRVIVRRADALDAALVAIRLGVAAGVRRAYRPAGPALWFAPLADLVAVVAVAAAAMRRTVTWRGRRLPVSPLLSHGRVVV
jgi:dolichol-phosphate mannosyltransferase